MHASGKHASRSTLRVCSHTFYHRMSTATICLHLHCRLLMFMTAMTLAVTTQCLPNFAGELIAQGEGILCSEIWVRDNRVRAAFEPNGPVMLQLHLFCDKLLARIDAFFFQRFGCRSLGCVQASSYTGGFLSNPKTYTQWGFLIAFSFKSSHKVCLGS